MVTTHPPKTIVKPTALGPVANTDTKLLIYSLFQKGRVLAQDGEPVDGFSAKKLRSYYLLNPLEEGEHSFKLLLTQTDKQSMLALMQQKPQPAEPSLRITENFAFFEEWVQGLGADLTPLCKGLAKLMIVDIALTALSGLQALRRGVAGRDAGCLRCLLLVMCTHSFEKKALTLHLARSEGHERYFGCNLMQREVLASSHQHLMAEVPAVRQSHTARVYGRDNPRSGTRLC